MSMTISMSFFPSEGKTVKAFASMLRRFTPNANVQRIKKHKKYQGDNIEKLDLDVLMSIIESPESESLADSRDSFAVELGYTLTSGELIPLNIDFYGKGYMDGHYARDDSSLQITAEDSSLWFALKRIARDMYDTGLDVPQHLKNAAAEKVNIDSVVLFLKACGFTINEDTESWEIETENYLNHAAVYYESGWSCPLRCQMVYHKDPQEFAKDFERIYADYHWGIAMPLLYSLDKEIWQLSESEIASLNEYKGFARRCGKEYPGGYKYFSRPQKFAPEQTELDAVNFVESLSKEKVQKLSKLPVSEIKAVFSAVAESALPEVRYFDFDEQGMVLLTGAHLSVWRAYRALAELAEV